MRIAILLLLAFSLEAALDFNRDVRPILSRNCFFCLISWSFFCRFSAISWSCWSMSCWNFY